jgi:predicted esterase
MPAIERHLRVGRTARFYQLGTPGANTLELWVACHGYGQLAAPFIAALQPLDAGTRVVVAPEGLSRFYLDDPLKRHTPDSPVGASWMTREDRLEEIADHVEYLDTLTASMRREIPGGDVRVVVLGFSQGVATVCRWAAQGSTEIHRLILWGGTLPTDLAADKGDRMFRGASVTLVAGRADPIAPEKIMERERRALGERGIHAQLLVHDGAHTLNSETLRSLSAPTQ